MIVLGPHVLVHHLLEEDDEQQQRHRCDRDGNDDDDDAAAVGDCSSTSESASAESKKSSNDDENNDDDDDAETNDSKDDEAAAERLLLYHRSSREPKRITEDDDAARAWRDARLNVSMALGSIGAPPLVIGPSSIVDDTIPAKSIRGGSYDVREGGNDHDDANKPNRGDVNTTTQQQQRAATATATTTASLRANLNVLSEMANAHTELLRTVRCILVETLSVGTSVRLGLGPVISGSGGNGRLVARAEKAWVARKQRQLPMNSSRRGPRLALPKVRTILHRALVDQAASLQGMLAAITIAATTPCKEATEWNQFALDLQHSLLLHHHPPGEAAAVLTLSRLSSWVDRLGDYLSFALSERLSVRHLEALAAAEEEDDDDDESMTTTATAMATRGVARRSAQFAKERIAFLHAACPPSRPARNDEAPDASGGSGSSSMILRHRTRDSGNETGETVDRDACCNAPGTDRARNDDGGGGGGGGGGALAEPKSNNDASSRRPERQKRKRRAANAIASLQAAVEAARVSLWALEQSFSNEIIDDYDDAAATAKDDSSFDARGDGNNNDDDDDAEIAEEDSEVRIWWDGFKDSMGRMTRASIPEFEERYIIMPSAAAATDDEGREALVNNDDSGSVPPLAGERDAERSEHVSNAPPRPSEGNDDGDDSEGDSFADKTLVFAGSGAKRPQKRTAAAAPSDGGSLPPRRRPQRRRQPPPASFGAADQTMLLKDLERRIKTMGLAEEHEVVTIDAAGNRGNDVCDGQNMKKGQSSGNSTPTASSSLSTRGGNDRRREGEKSQPLFLGVSGSLLAELSSAMAAAKTGAEDCVESTSGNYIERSSVYR